MSKRSFACLVLLMMAVACRKYLDKQPNASTQAPTTVAGYQAILDNSTLTSVSTPGLGPMEVADYNIAPATQSSFDSFSMGAYTWQPEFYQSDLLPSWSHPYAAIYACNTVLANLPMLGGLDSVDSATARMVLGEACFIRGFMLYQLEETFGQPFKPGSAPTDPGIPLRISLDLSQQVPRSSVQNVYKQIVADLQQAVGLLPATIQAANRNRPCRPAAYAMLARAWLTQQDYVKAKTYADSSLLLYDSLVDYNTVDSTQSHSFTASGNAEVLFQCSANNYPLQYSRTTLVDSTLYASYASDDLRKVIFFQPSPSGTGYYFKGQYTGIFYLFSGVAVDEVFLIRAESNAWNGNIAAALTDLNTLLTKRWRAGYFQGYTASTQDEALRLVLMEKRKETLFREGRSYDLRRLNQYQAYADTLRRSYSGQLYSLFPNDPRYAWPIPLQEIQQGGVEQNPQ